VFFDSSRYRETYSISVALCLFKGYRGKCELFEVKIGTLNFSTLKYDRNLVRKIGNLHLFVYDTYGKLSL